jgi:hypothetical protein
VKVNEIKAGCKRVRWKVGTGHKEVRKEVNEEEDVGQSPFILLESLITLKNQIR